MDLSSLNSDFFGTPDNFASAGELEPIQLTVALSDPNRPMSEFASMRCWDDVTGSWMTWEEWSFRRNSEDIDRIMERRGSKAFPARSREIHLKRFLEGLGIEYVERKRVK